MSIAILKAVWGQQQGIAFITTKAKGGAWKEHTFNYPSDLAAIDARIKKAVSEGKDVYWCPLLFKEPKRVKESALPNANILWADLDEVHPELGSLKPSIAWKSSDAKYQGIWLLDGEYDVKKVESVNQDLSYYVDADKSGWDITQVLRVPGTPNHKYNPPQDGEVLWAKRVLHDFDVIEKQVQGAATVRPTTSAMLKGWSLPQRVIDLLNVDEKEVEIGERSDRLWEIETALVEAGVPVLTIVETIKGCPWNKFKGRKDEDDQIYREVLKAEEHVKVREKNTRTSSLVVPERSADLTNWAVPYSTFVSKKVGKPEWLIDGIWQTGTYGMIAGEPKTYKSVLATDLALSVASGKPFLNHFNVKRRGVVLYVQEENNEATVQDRIHKIAHHKGLMTTTTTGVPIMLDLPIYFSNNFGIDLTEKFSREVIEKTLKQLQPLMLILDPLYMMLGSAEENSATEVRDILRWLTSLRNTYGCAIILCHHYNKPRETKRTGRGGTNMRGTSEFHAWVESALYVKSTTESNTIEVEREFRTFPATPQFGVTMEMGEPGEMFYRPILKAAGYAVELEIQKEDVVTYIASGERTFEELRILTRMNKRDLTRIVTELVDEGIVVKDGGRGRSNKAVYVLVEKDG